MPCHAPSGIIKMKTPRRCGVLTPPGCALSMSLGCKQAPLATMSVPFDTLKLARRFEAAGIEPKQAGDNALPLA